MTLALLLFALVPASSQASAAPVDIPAEIVHLAQIEFGHGVHERPNGSNNSRDIARYRTAFPRRARVAAWCGYFVSYIAKRAHVPLGFYGEGIGDVEGIYTWGRRSGRLTRSPLPGDLVVFRGFGHVGIVETVRSRRITTIEGNYSNAVSRETHSRHDAAGYVRLARGERHVGRYKESDHWIFDSSLRFS